MRMPYAAILLTISLLAACSEPGRPAEKPAASVPASVQDACGTAAETIKQHLQPSKVDSVKVQGQCTSVVIQTALDDEATETARQLCETAAEVAYTGDINSVAVLGKSGRELAIGIVGMKCLATH